MPNTIELFKKNAPELLDKIYKAESTTSDFDINGALVQAGKNANEIIVPVLDMDGLGDYDRNSGYIDGDVSLTNETKKFNYERGRKLKTDTIDNEETGGVVIPILPIPSCSGSWPFSFFEQTVQRLLPSRRTLAAPTWIFLQKLSGMAYLM